MSSVCIWDVPVITAMVSFAVQTCAMPPHINKSTYRIFILSSAKVLACIVTAIQMALMNSSVWSQFPSNGLGLAALVLQVRFCKVWTGILAWGFIAIACATVDAVAEATLVMSLYVSVTWVWRKAFDSLSCCSCLCWPLKSDCRSGLFWPRDSQYLFGSQSDIFFRFLCVWDCLCRAWFSVRVTLRRGHLYTEIL